MYDILGQPPAVRSGHAKGIFCRGVFTPTAHASELTRAPHMQDRPVEATVRFSNVTGDPDRPDSARTLRGMATKFHLDGGAHTDLVAITLPCFTNRTPGDFVTMNQRCFKRKSGKTGVRPLGMAAFLIQHKESRKATWATVRVPRFPSYANYTYNSLNAFRWIDAAGHEHYVRYSWVPLETEAPIGRAAARGLAHNYLQEDLAERLGRSPVQTVRFHLQVQLASAKDLSKNRVPDPTAPWPDKHKRIVTAVAGDKRPRFVVVGLLELTAIEDRAPHDLAELRFDPTALTDGIERSDDTILRFRHDAYALAFEQRTAPPEQ
jgi:catalase